MKTGGLAAVIYGAALLSTPATATNWIELGKDLNGQVYSIDLDEISNNGPMRSYWAKYDLTAVSGSELKYAIFRNSLNCEAQTVSTGYTMAYLRDGTKKPIDYPVGWKPIVPDTVAYSEYQFFCKK